MFSMNMVGPTRKMNSAMASASTMLMLDNHWIPRATPDTADNTNATVRIVMVPIRILAFATMLHQSWGTRTVAVGASE